MRLWAWLGWAVVQRNTLVPRNTRTVMIRLRYASRKIANGDPVILLSS